MERFYLRQDYRNGQYVQLKDAEHHHLKVMRIKSGEAIELVNGEGFLATARVELIEKEHTALQIFNVVKQEPLKRHVSLGIPFMRPSKLEWVIEKGTEIGADSFFLYPAFHSTQDQLSDHAIERLGNIMVSALKQSKRLFLPHLEVLPHLETLLKKDAQIYFGDPRENALTIQIDPTDIIFITGPESGFSNDEYTLLSQRGTGVRLNTNVLRAETAPLVALSLLCAL